MTPTDPGSFQSDRNLPKPKPNGSFDSQRHDRTRCREEAHLPNAQTPCLGVQSGDLSKQCGVVQTGNPLKAANRWSLESWKCFSDMTCVKAGIVWTKNIRPLGWVKRGTRGINWGGQCSSLMEHFIVSLTIFHATSKVWPQAFHLLATATSSSTSSCDPHSHVSRHLRLEAWPPKSRKGPQLPNASTLFGCPVLEKQCGDLQPLQLVTPNGPGSSWDWA